MKTLRSVLTHADPEELSRLTPADKRTHDRLLARFTERMEGDADTEMLEAEPRRFRMSLVLTAAACLTVVGGAGAAFAFLSKPPQESLTAQQQTSAQTEAPAIEEELAAASEGDWNDPTVPTEEPEATQTHYASGLLYWEETTAPALHGASTTTTAPPATTPTFADEVGIGRQDDSTGTVPTTTPEFTGTLKPKETTQTTTVTTVTPTPTQQALVDELLRKGEEFGGATYRRAILQAYGELPANQPRITVEAAKEIIGRETKADYQNCGAAILRAFDEIAGAPDMEILRDNRTYNRFWLDEEGKAYIEFVAETLPNSYITYYNSLSGESQYLFPTGPTPATTDNLTDEQRAALEALEQKGNQIIGAYSRAVLQAKGILPADQPRLTLEQAKQIIEEERMNEGWLSISCMIRFNEIAGAPDVVWGSGIDHEVWFLDDAGKEFIEVIPQIPYEDIIYVKCQTCFEDFLLNSVEQEVEHLYLNH